MTTLYNCKSEIDAEGKECWRITKFDGDMNVESSYHTDGDACSCPAGVRPSCRHRDMLPKFIARGAVNTHWFYDFDRGGWISSDVHLEGALQSIEQGFDAISKALAEPSISTDPGTQMPIAGERPVETRRETNPALIRRF